MLRIAVCDDDFVVCDKVEQLIQDYDSTAIVDVYHTPQRLIKHLVDENYDLYILDIEFPEASGLLIAKEIRRFDVDVPIVFLTSFEQYAMTVFKLHTFDYVLKPVSQDKIFSLLNRIKKYLDIDNKRFSFKFNKVDYSIPLRDIAYIEKNKRNVFIHTDREKYCAILSIKELLVIIGESLVRVHNSFWVNAQYVREIRNNHLLLYFSDKSNIYIPISKSYKLQARKSILFQLNHKA